MPELPILAGEFAAELSAAIAAAERAGAVLPAADAARPEVRWKPDGSPLTDFDLLANTQILDTLRTAFPADIILSEELADDLARLTARRVWIVDPLDGTRDFAEGSRDYAVHVALVVEGRPVVAVVTCPALGRLYAAVAGGGAAVRSAEGTRRIHVAPSRPLAEYRTGITRTSGHPALDQFLSRTGLAGRAVPRGASVKHMLLAEGSLDLCVTLHGREQEWDTAAPTLIVTEAGGVATDADGTPFHYNRPDLRHRRGVLLSAGHHHATLVAAARECFPA